MKVSVVLCSYNQREYLASAVESVFAQTCDDWELIVVDNGSSDGSQEVLRRWADSPRVRLILHEKNGAITQRLNHAIGLSRGEWISLLYSDDYYLPQKLERQLAVAATLPEDFGVLYSPGRRLNVDTGQEWTDPSVRASGWILPRLLEAHAFGLGFVNPITPLVRRECFVRHPFHEDLFVEGEFIFFRFALTHRFAFDAEPLGVMRDHIGNIGRSVQRNLQNLFVCLDKLELDPDFPAEHRDTLRFMRAYTYRNASWLAIRVMNDGGWARQMLARSVDTDWKMVLQPKIVAAAGLSLVPRPLLSMVNAAWSRVKRSAAHTNYVSRP